MVCGRTFCRFPTGEVLMAPCVMKEPNIGLFGGAAKFLNTPTSPVTRTAAAVSWLMGIT